MEPKLLYHITYFENLKSILQNNGLSAHSLVVDQHIGYTNIANDEIQARRSSTNIPVPCVWLST
jgi:hypothetical protein